MLGQILLGDPMLAITRAAIDHRDPVRLRGRAHATGEPAGEAHQMGVVQLLVAVAVPTPPPHPEAARRMPHGVVRVQDDPVHAVIAARQQIAAPLAEQVGHPRDCRLNRAAIGSAPQGPPVSGEVPKTGVAPLGDRNLHKRVNFLNSDRHAEPAAGGKAENSLSGFGLDARILVTLPELGGMRLTR
jgi:hypothetical protein